MKHLLRAAVVMAALTAALVGAGAALACGTAQGAHCYGIQQWKPPNNGYDGAIATISVSRLHDNHTSSGSHASNEMWVDDGTQSYTEAGLAYGSFARLQSTGQAYTGLVRFWADTGTDGQQTVHAYDTANYGQSYTFKILENTSGTAWNVFFNGSQVGTTTRSHLTYAQALQVGVEVTYDADTETGTFTGLQKHYFLQTPTWSYGWPGASASTSGQNNPAHAYWNNAYVDGADYAN
jgi:hypothetical protein